MSAAKHRLAVLIGRFQSFHAGHRTIVKALAGKVDSVLMLAGSSYRPRSWKNPFSFDERRGFILAGTADLGLPVSVLPLIDTLYNDRAWAGNVRTAVRAYLRAKGLPEDTEVFLTGFEKDKSSQYLKWFPEWQMLPAAPSLHDGKIINATDLRHALFMPTAEGLGPIAGRFGNREVARVTEWMKTHPKEVELIQSEGAYAMNYREKIAAAEKQFGFPIQINTVDSVVVQSGHVLLVRRGRLPGKGTLALPGGHFNPGEMALQAAIRELREETRLDVPPGLLANRMKDRRVFDHPERSERGWVRTEAFYFVFEDRAEMEAVKGGDDAEKADWVPISEITPDEMFEDHFDILQAFLPEISMSYSAILMAHLGQLR
ncbi:NUDIX domain-containing protein [Paracoccus litorisediminis]|uniref:NUDIX domain-containing protein n=1 Tax=Paracoccus litorisediminis TaxID=2006130 RepID=UPI00373324A5